MKSDKLMRLKKAGWKEGSVGDFLGLSPEEETFIELKLALAQELRDLRKTKDLTQAELAEIVGSSQSRVARMEAADGSVTLDLLVRSLLAIGASRKDLAETISRR